MKKLKNNIYFIVCFIWISLLFLGCNVNVSDTNNNILDNTIKISLKEGDRFGFAIENLGDINKDGVIDVAIGAIGNDTLGQDKGALYIIHLDTNANILKNIILNDETVEKLDLEEGNNFGFSIALLNDLDGDGYTDIAVGAPAHDSPNFTKGSVYILYLNQENTIKSVVTLNTSTSPMLAMLNANHFGDAITNIGDLNNDGVVDIAVSGTSDKINMGENGAVYILYLNKDGTLKDVILINKDTENMPDIRGHQLFGRSLMNVGDLDGDNIVDILVGAPKASYSGFLERGAIYILYMNEDGSVKNSDMINDNTVNGTSLNNYDYFGYSIESLGDIDNNGVIDIAVGSVGNITSGSFGNVHILYLDRTPNFIKYSLILDTQSFSLVSGDGFSSAISYLGDLNQSGKINLMIGSPYNNINTSSENHGRVNITSIPEPNIDTE